MDILKLSLRSEIVNCCVRPTLGAGLMRVRRRGISVGEPGPETCFEAGDVVVALGNADSLAAVEILLLQGWK